MDTENFETWDFIEKYYPNYYSCDYILLNDIFTRKLNNEYVCKTDKIFLKAIDVRKELIILNKKIWDKAIENYYQQINHNSKIQNS
ncbi:MAG: hypothetical protein V4683_13210 [Bacteroidota bacterium]